MNLLNFVSNFADEESCVTYLKEQRERRGVVCKHCGCTEHRWDAHKRCFECRNCHSRQSLRSGTVMQNSKLPFRYWIATMFLLISTKKSFSTEEIRRQLGHKRYQPVWEMVCKLRDVMGKRDAQYSLDGQVELDDGFFTTERPEEEKDTPLKRGRGSQKKSKVVVMVESAPSQRHPRKGKPSKVVGHLKMQVIPDLKTQTVTDVAKKHLEPSVELTTDDSTSYHKLGEHVQKHQTVISGYISPSAMPRDCFWICTTGSSMSIYSITSTNSATSSTEGISERSSSTGSSWLPSATTPISSQEHTDGQHADNHLI